jgi:signal transduction histidine kinase
VIRLGLFSRFFLLFGLTTILLGISIAAAVYTFSEKSAKNFIEERNEKLVILLSSMYEKGVEQTEVERLASEIRGDILRQSGQSKFTSSPDFPEVNELLEHSDPIGELYFSKFDSAYYLMFKAPDGWLVITSNVLNFAIYPWWAVLWPWAAMLSILAISYFILRRLLSPVFASVESVNAIGSGDLEHRINKHPKNELAELTKGINKMAEDLKQMFDAKNELLLAISHELRTPLARMQISLAMLPESKHRQEVKQDLLHMDELIGQLLEAERLESGHSSLHLETVYLPVLIDELMSENNLLKGINLIHSVPEIAIDLDVGRVKFLLRNLILNSVKHNDSSVKVDFLITQTEDSVCFSVRDNGIGIPQHALAHLFDAFYCVANSANRNVKGTGLGLYLCKKIALAHCGELNVTSELEEGSCFTFTMPNTHASTD